MESVCVYCGGTGEDLDHIPSRNLCKGNNQNFTPIKVPSCKKCNNINFSKDEVYFRDLLSVLMYEKSSVATSLLEDVISRSIKKGPGLFLARSMFSKMKLVNIYSKKGIKKATVINITKEDHQRVFNVLNKYIKGLFFYHFNKILPKDWIIKHCWLSDLNKDNAFNKLFLEYLPGLKWRIIHKDIFIYGYNFVPDTCQSIWCLVFFGNPLFFSFALDPITATRSNSF